MQHFEAMVIGSGQGGTPLAKKLAKAGMKTVIIEKRWIGGTCINDGCTPTKTLIADARKAYIVQQAPRFGIYVNHYSIDFQQIMQRKNEVVQQFRQSSQRGLEKTENLSIVFGDARFTGDKTVEVTLTDGGTETYSADKVFINTGAQPVIPDIEGLNNVPYYTSTTLLDAKYVPPHLVILGAGYIGLELGQLFKRLGSEVTIIGKSSSLLPREDEDVSKVIRELLEEEGIRVYSSAQVQKVSSPDADEINLVITREGQQLQIEGSHLLVAAGRAPQTKELNPGASGIETDERGFIKVNEYLETNVPGVYALGDVKPGPAFTHISYNDYLVIAHNVLDHQRVSIHDRPVPYCMFTDPQLGRIGYTEKQAREKGFNIAVATLPMKYVARAVETGETKGLMKAIVNKDNAQLIGAAIVGTEGGEVMTMLQLAMMGGLTYHQLRETIFAHPLYAESINNLFMQLAE